MYRDTSLTPITPLKARNIRNLEIGPSREITYLLIYVQGLLTAYRL